MNIKSKKNIQQNKIHICMIKVLLYIFTPLIINYLQKNFNF